LEKRPLIPTVRSLKECIRWLKELQKFFLGLSLAVSFLVTGK
jgi:hypothetical protein